MSGIAVFAFVVGLEVTSELNPLADETRRGPGGGRGDEKLSALAAFRHGSTLTRHWPVLKAEARLGARPAG